jgi:L-serine dehydratase
LEGEDPETVDTAKAPLRADEIRRTGDLRLNGTHPVAFDPEDDLILYRRRSLPFHPNGMTFTAYRDGKVLSERTYYSIGGGFVLDDDESGHPQLLPDPTPVPYPFVPARDCWAFVATRALSVSQVMLANECVRRSEAEVRAGLLKIWSVMQECVRARLLHTRRASRRPEGTAALSRPLSAAHCGLGPVRYRSGSPRRNGLGDVVGTGGQ